MIEIDRSVLVNFIYTIVFLFVFYEYVIYPVFFNPLTEIPGPPLYKVSKLFTIYDQWNEQRNNKVDKWHKKYGDIVQIAPNEIVFNDAADLKSIYLKKNLSKSTYYAHFKSHGEDSLFSTMPTDGHIQKKRMISKNFSKTSILSEGSRAFLNQKLDNVVKYIKRVNAFDKETPKTFKAAPWKCPIDVLSLFRAMSMDVVTGYECGSSMSSNLVLNVEERSILNTFGDLTSSFFYWAYVPSLWSLVTSRRKKANISRCVEWISAKIEASYQMLLDEGCTDEPGKEVSNLMTTMFNLGRSKNEIASEIQDHIIAGHETTATTIVYILWELSRPINIQLQDQLFDELQRCDISDLAAIDKLPLLHAIVQESTRLHAAIPGSEPREVKQNDEHSVKLANGKVVNLPAGTVVSVQPWSIQRKAQVFPNPDEFLPYRWLQDRWESDHEYSHRVQLMQSHMFAFGQGNRMCIGQFVALLQIKLLLAKLFSTFTTEISGDWCPIISTDRRVKMGHSGVNRYATGKEYLKLSDVDKMRMVDTYISAPLFGEVWLEFHER